TQAGDDSAANAIMLFSQFLSLAEYADLRKSAAGGSDGLIDVFANAGEVFTEAAASQDTNNNPATPWTSLANLTRRDPATVRALAKYFGLVQEVVLYQGQPGGFPGVDANSVTWTDPARVYWPQFTMTGIDGTIASYQANDAGITVFTNSTGGQQAYVSINDPTHKGQPPSGPAFADLNAAVHYNQPGYIQIGTIISNAFAGPGASARQVMAVGDFGDNLGLRRLWRALQLLQIVRLPVASLTGATAIVSVNPVSP